MTDLLGALEGWEMVFRRSFDNEGEAGGTVGSYRPGMWMLLWIPCMKEHLYAGSSGRKSESEAAASSQSREQKKCERRLRNTAKERL